VQYENDLAVPRALLIVTERRSGSVEYNSGVWMLPAGFLPCNPEDGGDVPQNRIPEDTKPHNQRCDDPKSCTIFYLTL
jgi:hypothetical protein